MSKLEHLALRIWHPERPGRLRPKPPQPQDVRAPELSAAERAELYRREWLQCGYPPGVTPREEVTA